jgi:hypothetical protein
VHFCPNKAKTKKRAILVTCALTKATMQSVTLNAKCDVTGAVEDAHWHVKPVASLQSDV